MKTKTIFLFLNLLLFDGQCFGYSRMATNGVIKSSFTHYTSRQIQKYSIDNIKSKQPKTNTIATLSIITGIMSMLFLFATSSIGVCIGLTLASTAIILGLIGKAQTSVGKGKGWGLAHASIILGLIAFVLYGFLSFLRLFS